MSSLNKAALAQIAARVVNLLRKKATLPFVCVVVWRCSRQNTYEFRQRLSASSFVVIRGYTYNFRLRLKLPSTFVEAILDKIAAVAAGHR